jgi:hypothetical protein
MHRLKISAGEEEVVAPCPPQRFRLSQAGFAPGRSGTSNERPTCGGAVPISADSIGGMEYHAAVINGLDNIK